MRWFTAVCGCESGKYSIASSDLPYVRIAILWGSGCGFRLLFLELGSEVFLFLFEVVEHVFMLLLVACKALLLPFARLQCLLFVFAIVLQGIVLCIYLCLYLFDARRLLLPVMGKLLQVAHTAHHLL